MPDKASLTCNIGACISSGVRIHLSKMQSIFFVPHRHQSKPVDRQKRGLPQNVGQTSENTGTRLQAKDENIACGADDRRRYADFSCCIKETSPCKAADARRRLSASHLKNRASEWSLGSFRARFFYVQRQKTPACFFCVSLQPGEQEPKQRFPP